MVRQHTTKREGTDDVQGLSALQQGQVLNLTIVGDGVWESIYTLPVSLGSSGSEQNFTLQLDTGSADAWVVASSCSSDVCGNIPGSSRWDPSLSPTAKQTTATFSISYAVGSVSGPIWWETLSVGGYSIGSQAIAAADNVQSEFLDSTVNGLLGLALSKDSVIADLIPPNTGSNNSEVPDGATFTNNLWGITPVTQAPANRMFGLLLERPSMPKDDTYVPSQLSIGTHPPFVTSSPAFANQNLTALLDNWTTTIVASPDEQYRWWRTILTLFTFHDPSKGDTNIVLPSGRNNIYPTVILDSGGSTILTTPDIANAIYGYFGVSPDADGNYYVPCTTPFNLTLTLASLSPIPLHPLDLSAPDPSDTSLCKGTIQASSTLAQLSAPADIILGVPFLRNVYTVMRYDSLNPPPPIATNPPISDPRADIIPSISLIPLTNITLALEQFHTVRVLNQPLTPSSSSNSPNNASPANAAGVKVGGAHLSIGIVILLVIVALVVAVGALFAGWWLVQKRRANRNVALPIGIEKNGSSSEGSGLKPERTYSATDSSAQTFVDDRSGSEFGERGRKTSKDYQQDPRSGSRSMSGYFRQPEPWEEMGVPSASEKEDEEESDYPSRSSKVSIGANDLPILLHSRTPSELREGTDRGAIVPLLGGGEGRRGSIPDSPSMDGFTYPPRGGDRYPPPLRRNTIADDPSTPTSAAPSLTHTASPPMLHARAYSDDRYPNPLASPQPQILAPQPQHSQTLPSHRPRTSSNNSTNAQYATFSPPPPPLSPIPASGSTTPTLENIMAGVGSGGAMREFQLKGLEMPSLIDLNDHKKVGVMESPREMEGADEMGFLTAKEMQPSDSSGSGSSGNTKTTMPSTASGGSLPERRRPLGPRMSRSSSGSLSGARLSSTIS